MGARVVESNKGLELQDEQPKREIELHRAVKTVFVRRTHPGGVGKEEEEMSWASLRGTRRLRARDEVALRLTSYGRYHTSRCQTAIHAAVPSGERGSPIKPFGIRALFGRCDRRLDCGRNDVNKVHVGTNEVKFNSGPTSALPVATSCRAPVIT